MRTTSGSRRLSSTRSRPRIERASGADLGAPQPVRGRGNREAVRDWLDLFSDRTVADLSRSWRFARRISTWRWQGRARPTLGINRPRALRRGGFGRPRIGGRPADTQSHAAARRHRSDGQGCYRAAELHPPDSPWRGISCFYSGRLLDSAAIRSRHASCSKKGRGGEAASAPLVQVFCLTQLTMLHLDRDDLESALRVVAQAREQLNRFHLDVYPVMAFAFAASSLTPRERAGSRRRWPIANERWSCSSTSRPSRTGIWPRPDHCWRGHR